MNTKILLLPVIGAATFFILLFGFTKIFGPIPFSVDSIITQKSTTFDVTGEGKVTVKPDIAYVNAGIRSQSQTVKGAQDQINSVINKVSQAVKGFGVAAEDIQTTNYNINPDYDFSSGGSQKIRGYTAQTTLSIKVRQIDKINDVIDASTQNGANEISGVSFDVEDKTKAKNEAREKAVAEAKKQAEEASKIAGFKLGKIINYSEGSSAFPEPIPFRAMGTEVASDKTTQVEPGSSEVIITATLSYEIF